MRHFSLLPHTKLGKYSGVLFLLFCLALLVRILQIADLIDILAFLLEYLFGAAAWITGLISVIRDKERSVLILAYLIIPVAALLYFESAGRNGFIRKLFT